MFNGREGKEEPPVFTAEELKQKLDEKLYRYLNIASGE